jgi:hypothetical protein
MKQLIRLLTSVILLLISTQLRSEPFILVTQEEFIASSSNPIQLIPKSTPVPDAPMIDLIIPKLDSPISSPTPIQVKFLPKFPAVINLDSFKVLYGTFQIDITSRILKVAEINTSGIDVKEASLPKGRHKLSLMIQDSLGRAASKNVEFEIK